MKCDRLQLTRTPLRAIAGAVLLATAGVTLATPSAYVSNFDSNSVSVIDVPTGTVTATIPVNPGPTGVAVSPDGTRVYVAHRYSNNLLVISTDTNEVAATIPLSAYGYGVAISPDGSRVYVAHIHHGSISVISTETNSPTGSIPVGVPPFQLAITPDGSTLFATCADTCDTLTKISTATNTVTGTTTVGVFPSGLDITPDGSKVYVASQSGNQVSVVSTSSGALLTTIPMSGAGGGVVASPSGDKVYVSVGNGASAPGNVAVISASTNSIVTTIPVGLNPAGIALTSDGSKVYVANYSGNNVSVIDTASSSVQATVAVGSAPHSYGKFVQPQRYAFNGFLPPVDNPPAVNVMKAGAAVPVKFSLGGDQGMSIFAAGYPVSRQVSCDNLSSITNVAETVNAGGSSLNYDSANGYYKYVWKTDGAWANTCREFTLRLNDNTEQKAVFRFSR